jgi:rubredoxin
MPVQNLRFYFENIRHKWIWDVDNMDTYICKVCGYVYNPDEGDPDSAIEPGTPFENLPDDWVCPVCGAGKDMFELEE